MPTAVRAALTQRLRARHDARKADSWRDAWRAKEAADALDRCYRAAAASEQADAADLAVLSGYAAREHARHARIVRYIDDTFGGCEEAGGCLHPAKYCVVHSAATYGDTRYPERREHLCGVHARQYRTRQSVTVRPLTDCDCKEDASDA